jgi:hypothetical protein
MRYKKSLTASMILVIVAVLALSSPLLIGTPPLQAQTAIVAQVTAAGDGQLFCPPTPTTPFPRTVLVAFSMEAAQDETGAITSGTFEFIARDGSGLTKSGTIESGTITSNSFSLSGTETVDTICGARVPSPVTLTGSCGPPPEGAPTTIQFFNPANGERATINGIAECSVTPLPPEECPPFTEGEPPNCVPIAECPPGFEGTPPNCEPIPLTEQFRNQGQCIREANTNPASGITRQACQEAFVDEEDDE